MNILRLEQERTTLKEKLTAQYSPQARLLFIFSFFDKVLSTSDKNLIDAFLPEFIPEYVFCLKNHSAVGMRPRIHELLIQQTEKIENQGLTTSYKGLAEVIKRLKNDLENLQKILSGQQNETVEYKTYFP